MSRKRACVVVLGDIGRSPRMKYHAISLAKEGYDVDVLGYGGSSPHKDLGLNPHIKITYMKQSPNFQAAMPRLLAYVFKVLWQSIALMFHLLTAKRPSFVLVQNPPAIPTLPVCWLACKLRKSAFVIDWHNYGFTILSLSAGKKSPLVKLCRFTEKTFGRRANASFCVTKAMKEDLAHNWGITATTLYDRPADLFRSIGEQERHDLFTRLSNDYPLFASPSANATLFTEKFANNIVKLLEDRPALLVSSTSWTEDEDFSLLTDALDDYDALKTSGAADLPRLVCVITGKGPLKEYYLEIIKNKDWSHVQVCTPWLEAEDYPKMLASADLGVCLHTSSSGLDLPMKVVDMFGCGLPVCAISFSCLSELVRHEENGLVFTKAEELTQQLCDCLRGFPACNPLVEKMRKNLQVFQQQRWHHTWTQIALPLLEDNSN